MYWLRSLKICDEVPSFTILHEQIYVIRGFAKVYELHNVGMGNFLADAYLIFCAFYNVTDGSLLIFDIRLFYFLKDFLFG